MNQQTLERIIYTSVAAPSVNDQVIQEILITSRNNNARKKITGALLYYEGWFLQILEGPRDVLEGLLETIGNDPRHKQMNVVSRNWIDKRGFPDWSMGYIADHKEIPRLIGLSSIGAITAKIYDESAFLRNFITNCREYAKGQAKV